MLIAEQEMHIVANRLGYCGRMKNTRRWLGIRRRVNKPDVSLAHQGIRRLKGKVYFLVKEVDLTGLGKHRRQVVDTVVMLYGKTPLTLVIAATKGNGFLADHTHGIRNLMAVLIQIRENTQPAGAVQEHAYENNQAENTFHEGRKVGKNGNYAMGVVIRRSGGLRIRT